MAAAQGVTGVLIPSYGPQRWQRQSRLLSEPHGVELWGGFGLHPWALQRGLSIDHYRGLMETGWSRFAAGWGDRLKAVGEFGLDRSQRAAEVPASLQQEVFELHLEWAERLRLPVILHLVRADGPALELLARRPPRFGGVVHGFSSHAQTVPAYLERGLFLSFGSALLGRQKAREALRATPGDRFLLETDGPQPLRRCLPPPWGPNHLPAIAEAASQVLAKSVEYVLERHRENCARALGLGLKDMPFSYPKSAQAHFEQEKEREHLHHDPAGD
jgi:TatD DNase family protein